MHRLWIVLLLCAGTAQAQAPGTADSIMFAQIYARADSQERPRFIAMAQEYGCDSTLTHQRGSPLHIGEGPCQVLRSYGAEFERRHVTSASGDMMTWYYSTSEALFWFTWNNTRWVLTNAVTH